MAEPKSPAEPSIATQKYKPQGSLIMNSPQEERAKLPLGAQGALLAVLTAPIMLPFAFIDQIGKGENAWLVLMVVAAVCRIRWELRGHIWFWLTIVLSAAAQIPIILWAPWTNSHYLGYAIAPFILLDFASVYGLVKLAEVTLGGTVDRSY